MKILIMGGGFVNKGAEAMTKTVQTEISRRIPQASFYFFEAPEEESFLATEGINLCPITSMAEKLLFTTTHPRMLSNILSCRNISYVSALKCVDAILDVSGYAFGDPWKIQRARRTHALVAYAHRLGKPYVFLPQAWGPFKREELRPLCRSICQKASLTYVRDDVSLQHVRSIFTELPDSIRSSPDIAFLFEGDESRSHSEIFGELESSIKGSEVVGIVPNMRIYERTTGTGMQNEYVRYMIDVCKHIQVLGYSMLVFPHEISRTNKGSTDDRMLCTMIEAGAASEKIKAVVTPMSAKQMKSLVGGLKFIFGSRFHALIAGLSLGLPVIALSWSHKYTELLKPFGLAEYAIHYESLKGKEQLLESISKFNLNIDHLASDVQRVIPTIRAQGTKTFDDVVSILQ